MDLDDVKKLKSLDRLLYWIKERESIRKRRDRGEPAPWTNDPILRTYRFCNVRRMDDKVSRWLLDNWYLPFRDHPDMLLAATLARQLNNTESLAAVGFPMRWEPERVQRVLEERTKAGLGNYSAAYMITANYGTKGRARETKPYQTVWRVCDPLHGLTVDTNTMETAWESLLGRVGFSSFIAGQVVADLRWAVTGAWSDKRTWAPMGPGSARGLARLLYRRDEWESVAKGYASSSAAKDGEGSWMWDFREHVLEGVRSLLPGELSKRLEGIDLQSCLCEWDKYERVIWGEGRPKQKYRPESDDLRWRTVPLPAGHQ